MVALLLYVKVYPKHSYFLFFLTCRQESKSADIVRILLTTSAFNATLISLDFPFVQEDNKTTVSSKQEPDDKQQ